MVHLSFKKENPFSIVVYITFLLFFVILNLN